MRLVTEAARVSGENPEKLRDVLASGTLVAGVRFSADGRAGASRAVVDLGSLFQIQLKFFPTNALRTFPYFFC